MDWMQACKDTKAATGTLQECGTKNGTEMWTHNHGTKLCEPFTYNGCGASTNMFTTQALCAMSCESPVKVRLRAACMQMWTSPTGEY